jgi:hypothetical protein
VSWQPVIGALNLGQMGRPDDDVQRLHTSRKGRVCEYVTCTTRLSIYNAGDYCGLHEHHEQHRILNDGTLRPRGAA